MSTVIRQKSLAAWMPSVARSKIALDSPDSLKPRINFSRILRETHSSTPNRRFLQNEFLCPELPKQVSRTQKSAAAHMFWGIG